MLELSWKHYINGEGANLTLSIADFDMSEDLFEDPGNFAPKSIMKEFLSNFRTQLLELHDSGADKCPSNRYHDA